MPIARLGLIHNTMPSHIRKNFSKSLVNARVACVYVCACAYKSMHVYVRVTKGLIESLHLSTCECVCKCMRKYCVSHPRKYNNGGLKVE